MNLYSSLVLLAPERKVSPQVNDDKRIINLRNLFGSKAYTHMPKPKKKKDKRGGGRARRSDEDDDSAAPAGKPDW